MLLTLFLIIVKTVALAIIFFFGMVTMMWLIMNFGHQAPNMVKIAKNIVGKAEGRFEDRNQNKKDD